MLHHPIPFFWADGAVPGARRSFTRTESVSCHRFLPHTHPLDLHAIFPATTIFSHRRLFPRTQICLRCALPRERKPPPPSSASPASGSAIAQLSLPHIWIRRCPPPLHPDLPPATRGAAVAAVLSLDEEPRRRHRDILGRGALLPPLCYPWTRSPAATTVLSVDEEARHRRRALPRRGGPPPPALPRLGGPSSLPPCSPSARKPVAALLSPIHRGHALLPCYCSSHDQKDLPPLQLKKERPHQGSASRPLSKENRLWQWRTRRASF